MKKKVLLSSIATIALCLSLIAGSTFALFTSQDDVNIAVTAGKVNVSATIADGTLELYSIGDYMGDGVTVFENGGTATIDDDEDYLTLERVTPGDEVRFDIQIFNDSNVHILYRVQYQVIDIVNGHDVFAFGDTIWQEWTTPATVEDKYRTTPVIVCFDKDAGNEYQEQTMKVIFTVEAIQGNADVYDALLYGNTAATLQSAITEQSATGGIVDGDGMSVTITANDGGVGLSGTNKLTLQNMTVTAEANTPAIYGFNEKHVELGKDMTVNVSGQEAVGLFCLYVGNGSTVTLDDSAVINASGVGASCIRLDAQPMTGDNDVVSVYLKGSNVLNPTNGAMGIYLTSCWMTYNIYVESEDDYLKYKDMVVEIENYAGTNTINWYINGVLVTN